MRPPLQRPWERDLLLHRLLPRWTASQRIRGLGEALAAPGSALRVAAMNPSPSPLAPPPPPHPGLSIEKWMVLFGLQHGLPGCGTSTRTLTWVTRLLSLRARTITNSTSVHSQKCLGLEDNYIFTLTL